MATLSFYRNGVIKIEDTKYVKKFISSAFKTCKTENEVEELTGQIIDVVFDKADNRIIELNNK